MLIFKEWRVSVWENEKTLEFIGGNGFTIILMCLMPLTVHLKMFKMINFTCAFYHNKKLNKEKFHYDITKKNVLFRNNVNEIIYTGCEHSSHNENTSGLGILKWPRC